MVILEALEFLVYCVAFWAFVFSPWTWPEAAKAFRDADTLEKATLTVESAVCAFCGLVPVGIAVRLWA